MKKRIFAIAVIAICLSILATTTLAYYTATDVARNAITSDGIDIHIEEFADTTMETVYVDPEVVMPGSQVDKVVRVSNLERDSFVRAKITVTMENVNTKDETVKDPVTITMGSNKWIYKDGWYYYNAVLGASGKTEPLMTKVSFSPQMGNGYQGGTIKVTITAQAVQADNNKTTVLEALGWPGEPLPAPDDSEE